MATKTFTILLMQDHFLYLPLYYAASKKVNFFGFLPPKTAVRIVTVPEHTDEAVIRQLLSDSPDPARDPVPLFAFCDPARVCVGSHQYTVKPVILAGCIRNGAFWVINHSKNLTGSLSDLARFDKIIAYHPGSTSYGIAKRALNAAGILSTARIHCVHPPMEIPTLLLGAFENSAALTPDALGVTALLGRNLGHNIEFELSQAAEFRGVVTTALITRLDRLGAHPDVIVAVLAALQKAMFAVHALSDEVVTYASERFNANSVEDIRLALERAAANQVYASSLGITEGEWQATSVAASDAHGVKWDAAAQVTASDHYRNYIAPYRYLLQRALRIAIVNSSIVGQPVRWRASSVGLGMLLAITCFVALARECGITVALGTVAILGAFAAAATWLPIGRIAAVEVLHWLLGLACVAVLFLWNDQVIATTTALAFGPTLLTADIGLIATILANKVTHVPNGE